MTDHDTGPKDDLPPLDDMPKLREVHATTDPVSGLMDVEAVFEPSEAMRILASVAHTAMKDSTAGSFITFEVTAPDGPRYSITVQRMAYDADTPSAKLTRISAKLTEAKSSMQSALDVAAHCGQRIKEAEERGREAGLREAVDALCGEPSNYMSGRLMAMSRNAILAKLTPSGEKKA